MNLHPLFDNPQLDKKKRYALRVKEGKHFVTRLSPLLMTETVSDARLLHGVYLNNCQWSWADDFEAVNENDWQKAIKESAKKTSKKNGSK